MAEVVAVTLARAEVMLQLWVAPVANVALQAVVALLAVAVAAVAVAAAVLVALVALVTSALVVVATAALAAKLLLYWVRAAALPPVAAQEAAAVSIAHCDCALWAEQWLPSQIHPRVSRWRRSLATRGMRRCVCALHL